MCRGCRCLLKTNTFPTIVNCLNYYNIKLAEKNYKISDSKMKVGKEYQVLNVVMSGKPGLGDIRSMMKDIDEKTKDWGEYISITDFRELQISDFLQNVILMGMEKTYKSVLSVTNSAILSFVILRDDDGGANYLKKSLEDINKQEGIKEYNYRYIFVKNPEEIIEIAKKLLS